MTTVKPGTVEEADIDNFSETTVLSNASRKNKVKYYAVRTGFKPGIYHTYSDCLNQIRGFKNPMFKTFFDLDEAKAFLVARLTTSTETDATATKFYAVRNGRIPGVYTDWPSAQQQIIGWTKPRHKAFASREEAEEFVNAEVEPIDTTSMAGSGASTGTKRGNASTGDGPSSKRARNTDKTASSRSAISNASTIIAPPSIPSRAPGSAALLPDAVDGFDRRIFMEPRTGQLKYKTAEEMTQTKKVPTGAIKSGTVDIYTDGSSRGNGMPGSAAGVGVYFGPNDRRNVSERLPGPKQTNQRAELQGLVRALDMTPVHTHARIHTDSQYSINCVTQWYKKWEKNSWERGPNAPVQNQDLIRAIRDRVDERERAGTSTGFVWVKGHADVPGNVAADKLAVEGSRKPVVSDVTSTKSTAKSTNPGRKTLS